MESRRTSLVTEEARRSPLPGGPVIHDTEQRNVLTFLRRRYSRLASLFLGLAGAGSCFMFTFWLSKQTFECPGWTIECSVSPVAAFIRQNRAIVQGVVSTVYGISLAMMAYAIFQVAETTLWPSMVGRSFTFRDMDKYIDTVRGSLPAAMTSLRRARGVGLLILITASLVALVQLADNITVGHAFSLTNVTTIMLSNHTQGGGIGLSFMQVNLPGALPVAVATSLITYNLWASNQVAEPLPHLRNFIIDRTNLSAIGNFSARAVELQKSITCTPAPIKILEDDQDRGGQIVVATHVGLNWTAIRLQPMLTTWVESVEQRDAHTATTRLMFAAINGTIENGYENTIPKPIVQYMVTQGGLPDLHCPFNGISSLACEITIALKDSSVCMYDDTQKCAREQKLLNDLSSLNRPEIEYSGIAGLAVWLASAIQNYGVSVYGAQPMFQQPGSTSRPGSEGPIPAPWTSFVFGYTSNWTQDQLKYFLDVGTGALAMSMALYCRSWPVCGIVTL